MTPGSRKKSEGEDLSSVTLPGIRACVFDAYGTVFDFASAAARCRDTLGDKLEALTVLWREKQLQYTWLRTAQNRYVDFWHVTRDALDFALDSLDLADNALRDRLMSMYLTVDAFPEVPKMLSHLKAAGSKTAILSNGTRQMLHAAVENTGIGHLLDDVLSVESIEVYKPHPKVYQLVVDRLQIEPQAISFQSSNAWDAYAASAFGMRAVWCNRTCQPPERLPGKPDFEIGSLAELPALLGV